MLRVIKNFNLLKICPENLCSYSTAFTMPYNPALLPVKKSHRKPRWVPVAKSKRFKIPVMPQTPEDERKEILRLYNNYRNNVQSIQKYLTNKYCTRFQKSLDPEEILKNFKEDFIKCQAINDEWNEKVKITREARVQKKHEEDLRAVNEKIEEQLRKEEEIRVFAEELVRKEKEASITFITPENIDAAIDKALNELVDYNYAIDLKGEKIVGRTTRPPKESEKAQISLKQ